MEKGKEGQRERNNIIIRGVDKWEENKIEQEVKEFIKENLKLEVEVGKAFKIWIRGNKCTVVAELRSWETKKRYNEQEKRIKGENLYRRRPNENGKRNTGPLKR